MRTLRAAGSRLATVLLVAALSTARAATHEFAVDVPSDFASATYTPDKVIRWADGLYATALALPPNTPISALHRRPDGTWLFSPFDTATLGGVDYEPRDVVSYDGVNFALQLDGSAVGIPQGARIDAVFVDAGALVMSFDTPVALGGVDYGSSDFVKYAGSFTSYWIGSAHGVPSTSNIVGGALDGAGQLLMSFDVPTRLGPVDYLPGDIVRWSGSGFSTYWREPAWPAYAEMRDFSIPPAAGTVPEGGTGGGTPLTVQKAGGGNLLLNWGASCASSDTDYEIYEGLVAAPFSSHSSIRCSTSGATSATITPASGNRYYLVVPRNVVDEGSYGKRSDGTERPAGAAQCLPRSTGVCS